MGEEEGVWWVWTGIVPLCPAAGEKPNPKFFQRERLAGAGGRVFLIVMRC